MLIPHVSVKFLRLLPSVKGMVKLTPDFAGAQSPRPPFRFGSHQKRFALLLDAALPVDVLTWLFNVPFKRHLLLLIRTSWPL